MKMVRAVRSLALAGMLAVPALVVAAQTELAQGEIKKVNRETSSLTIRHGELKNLGMMPMTMVFKVKQKEMLDRSVVGAKVRFLAEKVDGVLTVTVLEADQ